MPTQMSTQSNAKRRKGIAIAMMRMPVYIVVLIDQPDNRDQSVREQKKD